jgi:hypothetical protein
MLLEKEIMNLETANYIYCNIKLAKLNKSQVILLDFTLYRRTRKLHLLEHA